MRAGKTILLLAFLGALSSTKRHGSPNLPLCLFSLSPTPSLDCYNIINATQGSSHTKKRMKTKQDSARGHKQQRLSSQSMCNLKLEEKRALFFWVGTVGVTCSPGPQFGHQVHLYFLAFSKVLYFYLSLYFFKFQFESFSLFFKPHKLFFIFPIHFFGSFVRSWVGTVKVPCLPSPQLGHQAHLYFLTVYEIFFVFFLNLCKAFSAFYSVFQLFNEELGRNSDDYVGAGQAPDLAVMRTCTF